MVHCEERSSEIIIGHNSHINLWEQGGVSQVNYLHRWLTDSIFLPYYSKLYNYHLKRISSNS